MTSTAALINAMMDLGEAAKIPIDAIVAPPP